MQSIDQGGEPYYDETDVEEIVSYASTRHVEVIPEINLPGHATASLGQYPELRCTVPDEDPSFWSVCLGAEETYGFIDALLDQLAEQFPSDIVHVGGDEWTFHYSWEDCEVCQERMDAAELKDIQELFVDYLQRVHEILTSHDRRMMVWNEEIDITRSPDLPEDVQVQFWRWTRGRMEENALQQWAEAGNDVVNSYLQGTYIGVQMTEETARRWSPTSWPPVTDDVSQQICGGELPAWNGWGDQSWEDYGVRAMPSGMAIFGDRVWNGDTIDDPERFNRAVQRQVLGPAVPADLDIFEELGSSIFPLHPMRGGELAHLWKSLDGWSVSEAVEQYRYTAEQLSQICQSENTVFSDASAYVDALEWLMESATREQRGVSRRPAPDEMT